MKLAAVFIVFYLAGQAQFPIICAGKGTAEPFKTDTILYKKAPCAGPRSQQYYTARKPEGLVLKKTIDSAGTHYSSEKIIIPSKNSMNFQLTGKPEINCDLSESEYKGRIYICWSDKKNGKDNDDVFLIYSDDKGESWTEPILVTYHPNHKKQFHPSIQVDSKTGYVYLVYYDKQNFLNSEMTDIYLAMSKNGGLKFDYFKLNNKPVKPTGKPSVIREPASEKNKNGSVNTNLNSCAVIVNDSTIAKYNAMINSDTPEMQKSIVFQDEIRVDFKIKTDMFISAAITKPLEAGFEKIIVKERKFKAGNNTLLIKTKKSGLEKQTYVLTLYYNNKNTYSWITAD